MSRWATLPPAGPFLQRVRADAIQVRSGQVRSGQVEFGLDLIADNNGKPQAHAGSLALATA